MKKITLMLAAVALSMFGGMLAANAAVCGTDTVGRTKTDPFGSCEGTTGSVKCGTGTNVGGVFTLIVLNSTNKGVQGCSHAGDLLPIGGRVGVLVEGDNDVSAHIDGSDSENAQAAGGWQRYDVRPNEQAVCVRRGDSGTWWTGASSGKGSSNPNLVNQGINSSGNRTPCGGSPVPA